MFISDGFKEGQEAYRTHYRNNRGDAIYNLLNPHTENPFDPNSQDYEDFWDGFAHEREVYKKRHDYKRLKTIS